jgi:hypothetical protein
LSTGAKSILSNRRYNSSIIHYQRHDQHKLKHVNPNLPETLSSVHADTFDNYSASNFGPRINRSGSARHSTASNRLLYESRDAGSSNSTLPRGSTESRVISSRHVRKRTSGCIDNESRGSGKSVHENVGPFAAKDVVANTGVNIAVEGMAENF